MKNTNIITPSKKPIIQGHRGARGLYPENTITAFIEAVKLGVDTLEMDVVISKDLKVIVSHEPWMNYLFCTQPNGKKIEKEFMLDFNLYKMNYEEIKCFDCGIKTNPGFPKQKSIQEHKPLLSEVLNTVETFVLKNNLLSVNYNIEIKSEAGGDNIFHPSPEIFSRLVYDVLKEFNIFNKIILQSFDVRILKKIRQIGSESKIGLLVENKLSVKKNIENLGFTPYSYNPHFSLITEDVVKDLHTQNIKIAVWTVNETSDMERIIKMGVDSIITDYPDKALLLIK